MIHQLAEKIAEYLGRELKLENSRKAVITYGLEIVLGGLVKLLVFLAIPFILGILHQTWAAVISSVLYRLPAGGAHCSAYYRCLAGSLVTFSFIGLLAKMAAGYNLPVDTIVLSTLILAAVATAIWVPADTEKKPVTRPGDRIKAKIWAYGVLFAYVLLWYTCDLPRDLVLAGSVGLLIQVFTVTPAGYRAMDRLDRILAGLSEAIINRKEVA